MLVKGPWPHCFKRIKPNCTTHTWLSLKRLIRIPQKKTTWYAKIKTLLYYNTSYMDGVIRFVTKLKKWSKSLPTYFIVFFYDFGGLPLMYPLVTRVIFTKNVREATITRKTSNISRTLSGNKIVDHTDVVGASPVGAAPTTSSFST